MLLTQGSKNDILSSTSINYHSHHFLSSFSVEENGASFPITSLGASNSSTGQQFILIRPNYLKRPSNRKEDQYSTYEDRKYAYFYTKESPHCKHIKGRNGWWYPFQFKKGKDSQEKDIPICRFNPHDGLNTNLNGLFDEVEDKNERSIAVCDVSERKCFQRDKTGKYIFKGKTLKLRKVEILLGRPEKAQNLSEEIKTPEEVHAELETPEEVHTEL